jgi:hypothetical protein
MGLTLHTGKPQFAGTLENVIRDFVSTRKQSKNRAYPLNPFPYERFRLIIRF